MKFFPYESWTLESPLDVPTLAAEISRRVEPRKLFRFGSRESSPMEGKIGYGGFNINRIIHYRNSFLPVIYGGFIPKENGTLIRIRMTLHPFTFLLLVPIVGLMSIFSLALIASGFDDATWGMLGVLGGMFFFLLVMMYGGFFLEAGKSKKLLAELLMQVNEEFEKTKMQSEG